MSFLGDAWDTLKKPFENGLGGLGSKIYGSENDFHAEAPELDPNAYQYGGQPGAADDAANRYRQMAEGAQNRQATQAQNVGVNYGQSNYDRQQGQQARQGQASLAQLMNNRAQGLGGPSIAQQQADRQMGQAQAQQASLAGSARGAGGLAAANRTAAFNMANAASDISGQAQINAAGERRDDTNAAAGMYGAMRGGDLASQNQAANQSQFRTQSQVQQNQYNAGLRDAQSGRDDAFTMGMTNNEMGVRNSQLTAGMNQQAQSSANRLNAQGINAGIAGQNAQMNQANGPAVLGAVQSLAGGAAGVVTGGGAGGIPGKARGGLVSGRMPYLVGEQGPELVVPKKDGFVLTADQTQQALANAPPRDLTSLFDRGHAAAPGASLASIMGSRAVGAPRRDNAGPFERGGNETNSRSLSSLHDPPQSAHRSRVAGDSLMALWGLGPRRAEGGAVDAGGAPAQQYVPSTWGVGPGLPMSPPGTSEWEAEKAVNLQRAGEREYDGRAPTTTLAIPGFTPGVVGGSADEPLYRRDQETSSLARAKEAQGLDLSDREAYEAQGADYRLNRSKKLDRQTAAKKNAEKTALPPRRSLSDILAGANENGIDTSYRPGSHFVAPNLLALPARAFGGPISAGGAMAPTAPGTFSLGNITNMIPFIGGRAGNPASGPATPSYEVLSGGGENVAASGQAMSDYATRYGRDATAGGPVNYGGMREDGGPVQPQTAYVAGERGPELVVPTKSYDTPLTPKEEEAFQSWKQFFAPNDSGEDYDYRGAFKAGAGPGSDGHWVDTFKKPNHPTFSVESQYARGADAARAGRWVGDRFVPAKVYDASRPEGDRFVPARAEDMSPSEYQAYRGWLGNVPDDASRRAEWHAGEPAGTPPTKYAPPPSSPAPKYVYDASKPFGERFQPRPERQMTSFTRGNPEAEARDLAARKLLADYGQHIPTPANAAATMLAQGPEVVHATAPAHTYNDADRIIEKSALQSLLAGAGVGAPTAAAGVARFVNDYFAKRGQSPAKPEDDEEEKKRRSQPAKPRLAAIMRGGR